ARADSQRLRQLAALHRSRSGDVDPHVAGELHCGRLGSDLRLRPRRVARRRQSVPARDAICAGSCRAAPRADADVAVRGFRAARTVAARWPAAPRRGAGISRQPVLHAARSARRANGAVRPGVGSAGFLPDGGESVTAAPQLRTAPRRLVGDALQRPAFAFPFALALYFLLHLLIRISLSDSLELDEAEA